MKCPRVAAEEFFAVVLRGDTEVGVSNTDDGIALIVNGFVALREHVNAGVDEEDAKNGKNPMEAGHEDSTSSDHHAAHEESADDAPGKHAVLHTFVNLKGAENNQEDEEIINAESFFDDVASEVFEAPLFTSPMPDPAAEGDGKGDPDCAEECRFADADLVGLAMKDTQIEDERRQAKGNEANQQPGGAHEIR